jgi:hypothetical protein
MYIGILLSKKFWEEIIAFCPSYDSGHIENIASNKLLHALFVAMAVIGDTHNRHAN